MRRLYVALGVLALIAAIVTTGFIINTRTAESILEQLNSAYNSAESGDIEKARKIFREAKKEWSDNVEIMLLFISHGRIDRIDEAFDSAETYLKNDDIIMFLAECSTARLLTEHFIDVEYPYINNIF